MDKYGVAYEGVGEPAPDDPAARRAQAAANLQLALSVLTRDEATVRWLSDRLAELAASVPDEIAGCTLGGDTAAIFSDPVITDFRSYPAELCQAPGETQPNRAALAAWGSWVNAYARQDYGRPLFIACSADLADSTNIAGFAKDFGELPGWGWYERDANPRGALLPQEITEFTNAGILVGMASVNFARTRARPSTASGAPARPTRRSPTSSTARCASSARWPRTASSSWARSSGSPATPARRRRRTRGPTSASSRPASRSSSPRGTSSTCTPGSTTRCRWCWAPRWPPTCPSWPCT